MKPFEPPPTGHELPAVLPSPFDELGPHPIARRAAEALRAGLPMDGGSAEGKMFGVLVVQSPAGEVGYLSAFSGLLGGTWHVDGFVGPLFDLERRSTLEPEGEAVVKDLLRRHQALATSTELADLRVAHSAMNARHAEARAQLRARHELNRRTRQQARERTGDREALHALDQQSRADKAERRKSDAAQALEDATVRAPLRRLERRLRALERLRQYVCRVLMRNLHDTYVVMNARGEQRPLRALYAPHEPPSGAGDCAAPKLIAAAYRKGLRPLALAEFWWGATPAAGGRSHGAYYPACRGKCGPLLPFMLEGVDVAGPRALTSPAPAQEVSGSLELVYEDEWLVVIDKPSGLLSVPGRGDGLKDSVAERLRARYPKTTGPLLVHRLDQDTSGLLVAALDSRTHTALQRQFIRREVHKRYVAWVEGTIAAARGTIDLALRVDLDDRPRQLHDPIHGKRAITDWEVTRREAGRTRVALWPRTGRTHQLRVHAAHPKGLGAPIVGDGLYGERAERLLLHAEALCFLHPATGEGVTFERPAPF